MGRVRTGYHKDIYDLPIRGEMIVDPRPPEPPDRMVVRLKRWASKLSDRSYRMRLFKNRVRVQRTPLGMNGRLADWQMMAVETRLLLKENASDMDEQKAKKIADYLSWTKKVRQMDQGRVRYSHQRGSWHAYRDPEQTLFAVCGWDLQDNCMTDPNYHTWPVTYPWGNDWA